MRNIRKPTAILAAVFIAIILSSCATSRSFFDTRPYEETEEEKAIQYPFKVFGWYKNKLIEMEFRDKSNLLVSFPRIGGAKKVLRAAALTYVAALLMSILQLLRYVLIFLSRNNRRGGRE